MAFNGDLITKNRNAEMQQQQESTEDLSGWLRHLQKQSWELELLVTGFSIFLLFQTPKLLNEFSETLLAQSWGLWTGIGIFLIEFLALASIVIAVNLIIHVVLRAVWIGFVGLSSVFPEGINYNNLNISKYYISRLQKRAQEQTTLIHKLDQLASTIFAFSFFMACFTISVGIFILCFMLCMHFNEQAAYDGSTLKKLLSMTALMVLAIPALFSLLDILSFGRFKKHDRIAPKTYFFDNLISWITLYRFYSPIYYILISNYSRTLIKGLIILYMSAVLVIAIQIDRGEEVFSPATDTSVDYNDYMDERKSGKTIRSAALKSRFVEDKGLEIFLRFNQNARETSLLLCPELKDHPEYSILRIATANLNIGDHNMTYEQRQEYSEKALACVSSVFSFVIDDQELPEQQLLFVEKHPNMGERGLMAIIPTKNLDSGRHQLRIKRKRPDSLDEFRLYFASYFWKN